MTLPFVVAGAQNGTSRRAPAAGPPVTSESTFGRRIRQSRAVDMRSSVVLGAKDAGAPDQDVLGGSMELATAACPCLFQQRHPLLTAVGSRRDGAERGEWLLQMTPPGPGGSRGGLVRTLSPVQHLLSGGLVRSRSRVRLPALRRGAGNGVAVRLRGPLAQRPFVLRSVTDVGGRRSRSGAQW